MKSIRLYFSASSQCGREPVLSFGRSVFHALWTLLSSGVRPSGTLSWGMFGREMRRLSNWVLVSWRRCSSFSDSSLIDWTFSFSWVASCALPCLKRLPIWSDNVLRSFKFLSSWVWASLRSSSRRRAWSISASLSSFSPRFLRLLRTLSFCSRIVWISSIKDNFFEVSTV